MSRSRPASKKKKKNMVLLKPSEFHNLNPRINYRLNHLAGLDLKKMEPVPGEEKQGTGNCYTMRA